MKKLIAVCVFFLVVFLSGCTNKDKNVITFSSWGSQSEISILKPILKDFERENPGITVKFLHIPQNYFQKLHLLFASNLAPDVLFINNYYIPKYVNAGLLEDLSPYFEEELTQKTFFGKAIENFTFNKKIYAIPRDVSTIVIYYNKDLFKANNIPIPSPDWSIQEFINLGKILTKPNEYWGASAEQNLLYILPFLYSNNTGIIDKNGKIIIENAVESIQTYTDLINKYKIAPSKAETASLTYAQMFINGKIAMHVSGRWLVPKYREEIDFDWDIINIPSGKSGSVSGVDSSGFAISKSSKNKEASIKLVKYLSSAHSIEKITESGLIVPARKDIAYSEKFLSPDKKPHNSMVFINTIETGISTPVNKDYQKMNDIIMQALEPVFEGRTTAKEVITTEFIKKLDHQISVD